MIIAIIINFLIVMKSISINSTDNLNNKLQQLVDQPIQSLTIMIDSHPTAIQPSNVQILSQITSLKQLNISWNQKLSKQDIIYLMNELHHLQILRLEGCKHFNSQCVVALCQSLPNIKLFHYGNDYRETLQQDYMMSHFFNWMRRIESLGVKDLLLLSQLKQLKNIWIGKCDEEHTVQILHNINHLQQLELGQCDWQSKRYVNAKIVNYLKQYKHLKSITLSNIDNFQDMINIFMTNYQLDTIVIRWCDQLYDGMLKIIQQHCLKLKQLCIDSCNIKIDGRQIWNYIHLKTLILNGCHLNAEQAALGIKKLQQLEYLQLSRNKSWVSDKTLQLSISKLTNLRHLNIEYNHITNDGLQSLRNLTQLTSLLCGNTQVDGGGILRLTEHLIKVNKLSINNLNGRDQHGQVSQTHLKLLLKQLKITHLSIQGMNHISDDVFDELKSIKCLVLINTQISQECKDKMRTAGIYVTQWR